MILRILCLLLFSTSLSAQVISADEKKVTRLNQFRSDYSQSMHRGNPELISSYLSDNVRLMPAFQKTVLGKSNAIAYHRAFAKRFTVTTYTRSEAEIRDLGTQVLEIGKLTMTVTDKNKTTQNLEGSYLNLWEETATGQLTLITEAWNFDKYLGEFHDQLRFEEVPSVHIALQPNVLVNNNLRFELAALNRLLDATVTNHDAQTWSLYYADDAILIPGYTPMCKGRKAIDEYIERHAKELPVFEELDIRNDRVDDVGEYVVEYASHIASWKNGAWSGVGLGKNIRIWRREPDHSLKVFRSMAMYD